MKHYIAENPELLSEWDHERNADICRFPESTSAGVDQKVYWICKQGHSWQATPANRWRGQGCPVCVGKTILVGYNDLGSTHPELVEEWHMSLNDSIFPTQVTSGSNRRVWWQCRACGYTWRTSVANRVRGTGCPTCAKQRQGETRVAQHIEQNGSFADHYPLLAAEWDTKQNAVSPNEVSMHSHSYAWWLCSACGHSWKTTVYHRTVRESGCPACSNKVVTRGNCLATTHPRLLLRWNDQRNTDITPYMVTAGSQKKVWWLCENHHEWECTVNAMVHGAQCPICCGQKVLSGYNDLATVNPRIASEWHPSLNGDMKPTQFTAGSSRMKVWWLCSRGHEYRARISARTHGTGCPICDKERKTSFAEQAIVFYLSKLVPVENRYLLRGRTEIDIYLPTLQIGIEYDGMYFHSTDQARLRERIKDAEIRECGVRLIRVKETSTATVDSDDIIFCVPDTNYRYLKSVLAKILRQIGISATDEFIDSISPVSDMPQIVSNYLHLEKENSLAAKDPHLAAEWHPTQNGFVTPELVSHASGKKFWWLGACGHEWQMSVDARSHGNGCPICAGKQVLIGYNDLETTHPAIAAEWDYAKNAPRVPTEVTYGSSKKVWWLCCEGHSYEATPSNRSLGKGCPICANVRKGATRHSNHIQQHDCLAVTHPALCYEWHHERNGAITPNNVTRGSEHKVWWLCANGHDYQATIANRVHGRGCPVCAGKKIVAGINDLVTKNPDLYADWDGDKNSEVPQLISPNSHKKVWWKCHVCGHQWQATIHSRNSGVGCPMCARKHTGMTHRTRALNIKGSLADRNPALAAQWHPVRNGALTPSAVTAGCDQKAWWVCPVCQYEWYASIGSRNRGHGCPRCCKQKGKTSLE